MYIIYCKSVICSFLVSLPSSTTFVLPTQFLSHAAFIRSPHRLPLKMARLVYEGEELVWFLCGSVDALDISLALQNFIPELSQDDCRAGVDISVVY